jgi:hypothetical protein
MVLVALDSLLNVRWTHELPSTMNTTAMLRVMDVANGNVLCSEVLVRDYLAPVFEPRPPLNGPLRIHSSALVRLDERTGQELERLALDHNDLHYMPLHAWPRTDAPGRVITGQVYGKGYGAIGAFRASDGTKVEGWASGTCWYTDLLADPEMRSIPAEFAPVLLSAVQRADGTVIQVGELQSVQVGDLAGDMVSIIGMATGQVGLGSPSKVHHRSSDLVWLDWPDAGGGPTLHRSARPTWPAHHDPFDGSLNLWGAFKGDGRDVLLLHSDPDTHAALVVHCCSEDHLARQLPGIPANVAWIALPPAQGRLPVLIGEPGGEPLRLVLHPFP